MKRRSKGPSNGPSRPRRRHGSPGARRSGWHRAGPGPRWAALSPKRPGLSAARHRRRRETENFTAAARPGPARPGRPVHSQTPLGRPACVAKIVLMNERRAGPGRASHAQAALHTGGHSQDF